MIDSSSDLATACYSAFVGLYMHIYNLCDAIKLTPERFVDPLLLAIILLVTNTHLLHLTIWLLGTPSESHLVPDQPFF